MLSLWVIYAALGGISSNLFNFLSRYVLKDSGDSTSWAWFYEALRAPLFLLLAMFDFRLDINPTSVILFLSVGLSEFASVYLYMRMHALSQLSISTIISRTRLIWIPLIAFFFLGENLKIGDYMGIFLLFLGVSITTAPHKMFVDKGAIYANLAAFVIAINVILLKLATPYGSPAMILFFYSLPSVILFPIFMKESKQRLLENSKKHLLPKVVATLASMGASYFLLLALQIGEVSKVNAIYQGMMITGVIAGIVFLKEKEDTLQKIIGTIVALVGVILLA